MATRRGDAEGDRRSRLGPRTSPAIGITNQRETTSSGTGAPASRSTTPSSGRTGARRRSAPSCSEAGPARRFSRKTGLLLDPYFSGTKIAWLLDKVEGAREARRGRRARLRHDRQLPDLAADRRQGARHRCDQRLADAAVTTSRRRLGRRAAARCSASRQRCCRRCETAPMISASRTELFGGGHPDPRRRRRPAGRDHRPGLLRARA